MRRSLDSNLDKQFGVEQGVPHHLGGAQAGDADASVAMAVEVQAVEGGQQPEVHTGHPHQHRVLETVGEVGAGCVPRAVPVLGQRTIGRGRAGVRREAELY